MIMYTKIYDRIEASTLVAINVLFNHTNGLRRTLSSIPASIPEQTYKETRGMAGRWTNGPTAGRAQIRYDTAGGKRF